MNKNIEKNISKIVEHPRYEWLCKEIEQAEKHSATTGWRQIAAIDFLDRLEAMPVSYIIGWLDNKNNLDWTEDYRLRLAAVRGGYLNLFEEYPYLEIHKIPMDATDFYVEYLGFQLISKDIGGAASYVGKPREVK